MKWALLAIALGGCASVSCPHTAALDALPVWTGQPAVDAAVGLVALPVVAYDLSRCTTTREEVTVDLDALRKDIERSKVPDCPGTSRWNGAGCVSAAQ